MTAVQTSARACAVCHETVGADAVNTHGGMRHPHCSPFGVTVEEEETAASNEAVSASMFEAPAPAPAEPVASVPPPQRHELATRALPWRI